VAGLRRHWPDSTIHVLTYDRSFDAQRGYPVEFHVNPFQSPSSSRLRTLTRMLRPRQYMARRRARRLLSGASAVIASGGDVFSSDYGGLSRHLMPLDYALKRRVPVFFLGHSIGRFRTAQEAQRWLGVSRRSLGITLRESASLKYVVEDLALTGVAIQQTADTAFLLEPATTARTQVLRRQYGLADSRSIVACCVSQGITHYTRQDDEEHVQAWARLIRHITSDQQRQVLIIPHVQAPDAGNDDRILAAKVMQELSGVPCVVGAMGDHTAAEYKALIAECALVVAERIHAAIAGFSSGVPTLAVGYSIKAEGIVADVYGATGGSERLLVPFRRFVEPGHAPALFDEAWTRRDELARGLAAHKTDIRRAAERNFDVLAELLAERQSRPS
jgi:colanic acid/amylovoran biosynthesis protein WcaK/AmsJ